MKQLINIENRVVEIDVLSRDDLTSMNITESEFYELSLIDKALGLNFEGLDNEQY